MNEDARDGLGHVPKEVVDRLADLLRAIADVSPVQHTTGAVQAAAHPLQPLLRGLAGSVGLAVDPLTGLVEGQRQLAERMAEWAELQRQFADNMAAWADLQRQFADVLTALLGPLADTGRYISHSLDQVSGKATTVPGESPPVR